VPKFLVRMTFIVALGAFLFTACNSNSPSSPSGGGSPSFTPTPSFTPSPTPTLSPTPDCTTVPDISSTINGLSSGGITDILGNDASGTPGLYLEGLGSTGNIFRFQVSSPMTLTFSLCPTENPPISDRDMILAIRSGACGATADAAFNDDSCDLLPEIPSFHASPGITYYVVPMDYGPGAPYDLRILSGPLPGVVCTVTPVSTPQALPAGQHLTCAAAYDLGKGSPLSTGDSVGTGQLDDSTNTDDYYSFIPANSGTVTVSLDCYDNGLNQADFDLYGFSGCSSGTDQGPVNSSTAPNTVFQQFNFNASAGATYFIDVNAYFGGGTYRLTVQTP